MIGNNTDSDGSSPDPNPDPSGVGVGCRSSVVLDTADVKIDLSRLVLIAGRELVMERSGVEMNTVALPELTKT